MLSLACGRPSGREEDGMGGFARHVFPTVIPAKTGFRLPARHLGYSRKMGFRFRGNDERMESGR